MAGEITTTSLDDLTHGYLIEPVLIQALSEQPGLMRFCREFDIRDKATNAAQIPTETAYWGAANDRGAGVATAFNSSQATAIGNTTVASGNVTCTAAEYGVAHALTDNVQEDSVQGIDLMMLFTSRMLRVLQLAMDDDCVALYSGLSNTYGTPGSPVTVANMVSAQQGLRTRGVLADFIAYLLGNATANNLESNLQSGSAAAAIYALSADRLINYAPTNDNGMGPQRQIATFRGFPVYTTGLADSANAGVDEISACLCPSTAYNDETGATTHGMAWKRMPRFETQRQAKLRATDLVMTARAGFTELQDGSGSQIVTRAS